MGLAGQASAESAIAVTEHFTHYARLLLRGIDRIITLSLRTAIAIEHDFDSQVEIPTISQDKEVRAFFQSAEISTTCGADSVARASTPDVMLVSALSEPTLTSFAIQPLDLIRIA